MAIEQNVGIVSNVYPHTLWIDWVCLSFILQVDVQVKFHDTKKKSCETDLKASRTIKSMCQSFSWCNPPNSSINFIQIRRGHLNVWKVPSCELVHPLGFPCLAQMRGRYLSGVLLLECGLHDTTSNVRSPAR